MPFRTWCLAVAFGLIGASLQAQEQAGSRNDGASSQQSISQPFGLPVRIVEDKEAAEATERREEEAAEREQQDLVAQQSMDAAAHSAKRAAWLSAALVAIGTGLLVWTLSLTREANRAARDAVAVTRDIGQRQVRAYVGVHEAKADFLSNEEFPEQYRFMIILKNTGASPATKVRIWAACYIGANFPPELRARDKSHGSENSIGAGGTLKIEYGTSERRVPIEAVRWVRQGEARLWAFGEAEYFDVFGEKREVGFRFDVTRGQIGRPQMYPSPEGNYET